MARKNKALATQAGPSLEGIKTILATEAKGKPAKPEDFVDLTFIRELDQSGFIDSLYKKK